MLTEKLKQFNASQPEKVDESSLSGLESVMSGSGQPTAVQLDLMWTLLQWPQGECPLSGGCDVWQRSAKSNWT